MCSFAKLKPSVSAPPARTVGPPGGIQSAAGPPPSLWTRLAYGECALAPALWTSTGSQEARERFLREVRPPRPAPRPP